MLPSLSLMVKVAVDGVPKDAPEGLQRLTVKLSLPSACSVSFSSLRFTMGRISAGIRWSSQIR